MKTLLFSLFFQLLICCHVLQVSEGKKMLLEELYLVACSTLGCQINESTGLAFSHFFHPTRLANFPSYSFIRHYFLEFH